ncbi:MAG: AraC family transcriptional regulator [Clostridiales bacterium]|nr:AraC family transcriptional regulator [Clostridiales bacterium]MDY2835826.1 AraC family transcriptional regulator [Candidatus Aphodomonas sp.]
MKIFRSKVLLRYLLSYFMLLLITVTCVLFSLNLLRQAEYQVMDEGNRLALNRYKAMMDAQWEMIAKTSDMLSLNRSVREQMNITGALSAQRRYEMIQLCRQLSAAVQTNAYSAVREVLLYFPGTQSVVTMESRVSAPLYFENVCRYGEMSGEEAIAALEESWRSKYNILRDVVCVNQATGERSLCVARALDRSMREDSGVVVFLLDEQKMEQIAAECMGVPEECRVYLCDLQGRSLFHSQEDAELAGRPASRTVQSDSFDVAYCIVSDYPALSSIVVGAQRNMALMLAAGAAVGLAVACFLAYLNYRPIQSLWRQPQIAREHGDTFRNELFDIDRSIREIVNQNLRQQNRLSDILPEYASRLLEHFVCGDVREDEIDWDMLAEYGIRVGPGLLMAALLSIDAAGAETGADANESACAQKVAQTAAQVFSEFGPCYVLTGEETGLLLNLDANVTRQMVKQTAENLQRTLLEEKGLIVTFALGDAVENRADAWRSRMQAESAMEYAYTGNSLRVLCFWELPDRRESDFDSLQEYDIRLTNCIRSGDREGTEKLLDEMFGADGNLSYSDAELLMIHVLEICARCARQMNVRLELPEGKSFLSHMQKLRYAAQFREFILKLTDSLDGSAFCSGQREERLQKSVSDYVEGNFADPNLNVSMIAERLGVSQSYLSTHFKRQTGMNASDYIHLVRIRRACEMMRNESLSLSQIASRCGYVSDGTFIRCFKKYEGVTPGVFRKNFVNSMK